MDDYLKLTAGILIAVLLGIHLRRQNADVAMVLAVAVCAMVIFAAVQYLRPVLDFFQLLAQRGGLDNEIMKILFKAVGIGLVTEIAVLLCADSGSSALGKGLQMVSSALILSLSIPLMTRVLELVERLLGEG